MSGPNYPIIWIMRYLLLILAFPLFVHAETKKQQCDRLQVVASELEKMIQTKVYVGATKEETCDLLPASSFAGFDYRCSSLSAIEMQMKSLDNEIAMIKGIKALKEETIEASKFFEQDENKNKGAAVDASQLLYKNLKIAATIEGFLTTKGIKNENLLTVLAKAPAADFADEKKFKDLIASTCVKIGVNKGASPICDNPQSIGSEELKEVDALLLLAKETDRKFSDPQIKDLTKALAIKDGDTNYSFTKMLSEVSAPGAGEAFSSKDRETLSTIKLNDDFVKDYKFLRNLASSSADLAKTKKLTQTLELPVRFQDLFDSLKRREEWELKSKLSVVLNELKGNIPANAEAACTQTRALANNGEDCLKALSKNLTLGSDQQKMADNILVELKRGQDQIRKLDQVMKDCAVTEEMNLSKECLDFVNDSALEQLTVLEEKSKELSAHRAKILEKSASLMVSRDLAIHTLVTKECMTQNTIKIQCDQDIGNISREAVALSDAAGEIVMLWDKPAVETNVPELCKTPLDGAKHMEEICKIALAKESEKVAPTANKDHFMSSTEAPGARSSGQGWADLLGGLAQAAGTLLTPNQQMMNPYASMFPYTPQVGQPRDIKNQIMDPYMVSGFGNYSSTPGLRPYSSVNSNVGASSAYSFGSSTFFNSPVGW